jgi:hypothetical protein
MPPVSSPTTTATGSGSTAPRTTPAYTPTTRASASPLCAPSTSRTANPAHSSNGASRDRDALPVRERSSLRRGLR